MDSSEVKTLVCKRSASELDEKNEADNSSKCLSEGEKRHRCDTSQICATVSMSSTPAYLFAMPLLPVKKVESWCSNSSITFTGTALEGGTGPPVGALDVGVSKSAYYFCISLPGVKKDPGEFSCEIQSDGKVCIRGVTSTGGKTVMKHSRVFEMKFQQQCSPGPFKLFFTLPGPVDPRLFSPCFRSDGIFEGVVAKYG